MPRISIKRFHSLLNEKCNVWLLFLNFVIDKESFFIPVNCLCEMTVFHIRFELWSQYVSLWQSLLTMKPRLSLSDLADHPDLVNFYSKMGLNLP